VRLKVRVEVDVPHNEMYVRLVELPPEALTYSVQVANSLNLDVDEMGRVVGIEITDMEKALGVRVAGVEVYGPLVGVKEAAALLGVSRPNFIRDYVSRDDFPIAVGDLASGRVWWLMEVVNYARRKGFKKKETVAYMLMVYLEANEMTVGALGEELGLDYRRVLGVLQDQVNLDEATPAVLAKKHGMDNEKAQALLARLKALRAISEVQ
jgi:uncharacterized protein YuzE